MFLNSRRASLRKTYFAALGSSIASTYKDIPTEVVRAVTSSKQEAEELARQINTAKLKAAKGWDNG